MHVHRSAGTEPAHAHPGRVAQEAVRQVHVEIGAERAVGDAGPQHVLPHRAEFGPAFQDVAEPCLPGQPHGLVLVDRDGVVLLLDRLERHQHHGLQPCPRLQLLGEDGAVPAEQLVQESAQDLIHHRLLGVEVVVEAAGQDAGRVGDVAHRRLAQPLLGEQPGGDGKEFTAAVRRGGAVVVRAVTGADYSRTAPRR